MCFNSNSFKSWIGTTKLLSFFVSIKQTAHVVAATSTLPNTSLLPPITDNSIQKHPCIGSNRETDLWYADPACVDPNIPIHSNQLMVKFLADKVQKEGKFISETDKFMVKGNFLEDFKRFVDANKTHPTFAAYERNLANKWRFNSHIKDVLHEWLEENPLGQDGQKYYVFYEFVTTASWEDHKPWEGFLRLKRRVAKL